MNILDLLQYGLDLFLILLTVFRIDYLADGTKRIIGAILICLIWFKMFDWMRLFDSTSFFIKLILETLTDVLPFFFIFPIFLMMFGSALYILNTNRVR